MIFKFMTRIWKHLTFFHDKPLLTLLYANRDQVHINEWKCFDINFLLHIDRSDTQNFYALSAILCITLDLK